jgi:amino acid transporter
MADKGLKSNVVGLFGGTMLGIFSVAPAYALTATFGILAASVGEKTPVVIIAGFLPMFFAAYAYREFNRIMPDAGTSFTWTSKAFGPYIGWLGGWTAVIATIIVLSNLAGVAVQFLYQFIGSAVNSEMISGLWENKLINVATCLVFLAILASSAASLITTFLPTSRTLLAMGAYKAITPVFDLDRSGVHVDHGRPPAGVLPR